MKPLEKKRLNQEKGFLTMKPLMSWTWTYRTYEEAFDKFLSLGCDD